MSKVVVYSCVTGNYDPVDKTLLASTGKAEVDVQYLLYTDQVDRVESFSHPVSNLTWELRPLLWKHSSCLRRTARWHKVNSHLLDVSADYFIWVDGSQRIKTIGLRSLVDSLKSKYVLGAFKHPDRTCAYQELRACISLRKDNPVLMQRQLQRYREDNYPPYNGLVETACVFRKYCAQIASFNDLWWKQLTTDSFRDQLSFNYVAWKLGLEYGIIPGSRAVSRFFDFVPHKRKL